MRLARALPVFSALAVACTMILGGVAGLVPAPALPEKALDLCSGEAESPPPSWAASLSQPTETGVVVSEHLVESEDGTRLSVAAYRPESAHGAPLPTIFIFSPYHALITYWKEADAAGVLDADCAIPFFTARGYNVVLGDMRGTRNSDGCFQMGGPKDTEDGVAVVNWIASQSWSDQTVGMYGVSHVGMSQLLTAIGQPPALKAILPIAAPTQFYRYLHMNGAKYVLNTGTPPAYTGAVEGPPPSYPTDANYADNQADTFCGAPENMAQAYDFDGDFDAFWQARDYVGNAARIQVPVFLVHGLVDENVKTDHFDVMWRALRSTGIPLKGHFTQHDHSEPVHEWWNVTALRWFDHWLKGVDTGMMAEPAVTIQRSDDTWRFVSDWPPPDVVRRSLWLADGAARFAMPTRFTDGVYTDVPFVPRALMREAGGLLVYETSPLPSDLYVTGPIRADVVASVTETDTNFAVLVYEKLADGSRTFVTRGYLDARHRDSLVAASDVDPGRVYRFGWDLYPRAHRFAAGSAIEVVVTSTDFCTWFAPEVEGCDRTGIYSDTSQATVVVHEGPFGSRLVLPIDVR